VGLGRYGELAAVTTVPALIEKIKRTFCVKTVGIIGPQKGKVNRSAVGAGSCGTMLRSVIKNKCDFYLTGELKHHHALELQAANVTTVCLSHSVSERIILPRIAKRLQQQCKGIKAYTSRKDHDPFIWQ
jgi:putative NIF3 family GTP cyclohydrolase 1 type 2